jgi:hypothetical protein
VRPVRWARAGATAKSLAQARAHRGTPVEHDTEIGTKPAEAGEALRASRCYAATARATAWRTARPRLEASPGRLITTAR